MITTPAVRAERRRGLFPRPVLLAVVVSVLTSLLLADLMPRYAPGLLRFEHAVADLRTSLLSDQLATQHPHVAVVGITDQTLQDYKARLPIDRGLLARLIDAIDAAGAKAIGIDILFFRIAPADNEEQLIDALRRAKAKIVLAVADERLGLTPAQVARQSRFIADSGRIPGYANLATERDWVVRFKAQPAPGSSFTKSFAHQLAEAGGYRVDEQHRRIAWLLNPLDGSDAFFTVPAETLLAEAATPGAGTLRAGLKDKIVIVGGLFPDLDQHLTPLSFVTKEKTPGAVIHAQIVAEMVDGRRIGQLEPSSFALRLGLIGLSGFGFLIGWRYRLKRQGILLSSLATVVIVTVDTFVFWQSRIILPVILALLAWFIGEFSGHYIGRWLGHRHGDRSRWFVK
jgi:CHASE2 domain-containing sensor protein